jgi:hypothetical protein
MAGITQEGGGWVPHVTFNPIAGSARGFADIEEMFYEWRRTQTPQSFEELGLKEGWNFFTPEIAEQALLRNIKNRNLRFQTMRSYAFDVKSGDWKKTGQPIIFGKSGRLLDGAHRVWAVYLTGVGIWIYVILDVDDVEEPNMFAYIDHVLRRSNGDALETAGLNGLSDRIANVITSFAKPDDDGLLSLDGVAGGFYMSPVQVLAYQNEHPELSTVGHVMQRHYKAALKLLNAAAATYLAWRIVEEHGYEALHGFMRTLLLSPDQLATLPPNHPVRALHLVMELHFKGTLAGKDSRAALARRQNILSKERILAYSITAFNMTLLKQEVGKSGLVLPLQGFPHVITKADLAVEMEDEVGFGDPDEAPKE